MQGVCNGDNFKKKKMKLLTDKKKLNENAKICYIFKKKAFQDNNVKYKKYNKGRDHCHYTG